MREAGLAPGSAPTVTSMSTPNPGQPYRRFESLETEIVWAAVERLDIADQHDLLEALTQELYVEPHLRAKAPSARESRAVLALREAANLLGHSPSIKEFADIADVHPEYGWPHPSRVRAWLGSNSWNTALERAGLQPCATDAIVRERIGARFSEDTLKRALQLAAAALEAVPTFEDYVAWVRRPDVIAAHGLLPRAHRTFTQTFGSWMGACTAAGLRDSDVLVTRSGVVRYGGTYSRQQAIESLRLIAAELGRTPGVEEYKAIRSRLLRDPVGGSPTSIPSADTIKHHFQGNWATACLAAGLADPGVGKSTPFTDAELLAWMRRAIEADAATSAAGYDKWRAALIANATKAGKRIRVPSAQSIKKRFRGWRRARAAAELGDSK